MKKLQQMLAAQSGKNKKMGFGNGWLTSGIRIKILKNNVAIPILIISRIRGKR